MKTYLPLLTGILFLLSACTPEDETPAICSAPPPPDYYPLAVGNYWIYDWYSLSTENTEEKFFLKDTLEITGLLPDFKVNIKPILAAFPSGKAFLAQACNHSLQ